MQINPIVSVSGFTLFSVLSIIWGINLPEQQLNIFNLIWLFILFPAAGLISGIPLGYTQIGFWRAAAFTLYTAIFSQLTHWIVFQSLDGESFLMTCALTIIGLGIGDLIHERRQHKKKTTLAACHRNKKR